MRDVIGACREVEETRVLEALDYFSGELGGLLEMGLSGGGFVVKGYLVLHGDGVCVLQWADISSRGAGCQLLGRGSIGVAEE